MSSSPSGVKHSHFSTSPRAALGSTQAPIQYTGGFFAGVKWKGREADHSPPTSAKVKKKWIYTSMPSVRVQTRIPGFGQMRIISAGTAIGTYKFVRN
jgi:hypothetical protein